MSQEKSLQMQKGIESKDGVGSGDGNVNGNETINVWACIDQVLGDVEIDENDLTQKMSIGSTKNNPEIALIRQQLESLLETQASIKRSKSAVDMKLQMQQLNSISKQILILCQNSNEKKAQLKAQLSLLREYNSTK
mmetsp:Transcript_505/g.912  ORF Transcript_505/g.912 Transcript_505/m.912 type:complete len:136 (-) Transcript_505:917-1324(-)|eukprot:CAMPEP_0182446596 /NCGR_PEP_ID=MMETSP1172-20130603/4300_1 /TAXON_ID=708627 /ORGANISM="Timspurckia oligopyrenoides, Strain CCMP3278" /LENGTH=135 /DNA_ID=CAMNT_0024642547 /DNA_START=89 /DNA_END=496 /DNA_ORIENTATION=-